MPVRAVKWLVLPSPTTTPHSSAFHFNGRVSAQSGLASKVIWICVSPPSPHFTLGLT